MENNKYILLPKKQAPLPSEVLVMTLSEFRDNRPLVESFSEGPLALDFETNSYDWRQEDFFIRTVGLANDHYCVSIDLLDADEEEIGLFKGWLSERPYVAFNGIMESGAMLAWAGSQGKLIADCYILFADLSSDFRHARDLGTAMTDILGIEKEGDVVKDYMKANGLTWSDVNKFDRNILCHYNAIDAYGTWMLYRYFEELIDSYKDTWGGYYWDFHSEDCMSAIWLQVEARWNGMSVDVDSLEEAYTYVIKKRDEALEAFIEDPEVAPYIEEFNQTVIEEVLMAEPPKFTKAGKITKRWEKWEEKVTQAKIENHFNTNSTHQLRWLLFGKLMLPTIEYTEKGEPSTSKACLQKMGVHGRRLLEYRNWVTSHKFLTQVRDGHKDGTIHPFVKVFVTLTSRCGAGKLE